MSEVIKTATRDAYGKALVELGNTDAKVLVLDADLAAATKTGMFKKEHPEKFIDCGIAEGNMMGIAAGRAFEQVRNSIGYPHLNVKIGATHAGISVGEDGASHQCCEDIGLMRTIPGMVILNPADDIEARLCVMAAAEHDGPVYMRFGRLAVPRVFDENYKFEIGKGTVLKEGDDVTIIATGLMVNEALMAYEELKAEGINARVVNMATIKPIDRDIIIESAKKTGVIVTAEEHNVIGGLGSAVAEVVCETVPVPVLRVGVEDTFGKSGPAVQLLHEFGLDAANIVAKCKAAVALKK